MLREATEATILKSTVRKRAVLYARTSTNDKAVDSLPSQIAICEEYAQEQNYIIVDRLTEDVRGVKGDDVQAPALNKALELAQAGLYDVLIIRDVKRYSRDVYKAMDFERLFFKAGIEIEYPWNKELNGLPNTGTGRVMRFLQYWMSEEDRLDTVKKLYTKRVEKVTRKGSVMTHGRPPFGYDEKRTPISSTQDHVELVVNEDEAKWVRKIFEWYTVDNLSLRAVTLKLGKNLVERPGLKHKGGNRGKRGPFQWSPQTVRDILNRHAYFGEWRYSKNTKSKRKRREESIIAGMLEDKPVTLEVPAIISKELFDTAQVKLEKNRKKTARKKIVHKFLMRSRAKCGQCGYACRCVAKKKKNYYAYSCNNKSQGKMAVSQTCDLPTFKRDIVDADIWAWLESLMNDDTELKRGYEDYIEDQKTAFEPLQDELRRIDDNLTEVQERIVKQARAIVTLSEIGSVDAVEAIKQDILQNEAMKAKYQERQAEVKSKLEKYSVGIAALKDFDEFVNTVRTGMKKARGNFDKQLEVIESLDVRVILTVEDGQQVFYPSCVFRTETSPILVNSFRNELTTMEQIRIQTRIVYNVNK